LLALSTPPKARPSGPPALQASAIVVAAAQEHRETLRRALAEAGGTDVLGVARDARDCVSAARRLRPDLAVLWLDRPRTEALAAAGALAARAPEVRVVLLTAHRDLDFVRAALAAGVVAYVPVSASADVLADALRTALRGQAAYPARALRELADERPQELARDELLARLTPRELDVLRHVALGLTNAEIAARLAVTAGTVKIHVERLIAKLGVGNRTQAAVHAAQAGLLAKG
jgi:DNA-binding NarL/FixJ family response regulator